MYLIKKSIKIKYRGRISPTRTMFQSQCRIFVTTVTEVVASGANNIPCWKNISTYEGMHEWSNVCDTLRTYEFTIWQQLQTYVAKKCYDRNKKNCPLIDLSEWTNVPPLLGKESPLSDQSVKMSRFKTLMCIIPSADKLETSWYVRHLVNSLNWAIVW